jgi:hypothetical protein
MKAPEDCEAEPWPGYTQVPLGSLTHHLLFPGNTPMNTCLYQVAWPVLREDSPGENTAGSVILCAFELGSGETQNKESLGQEGQGCLAPDTLSTARGFRSYGKL